MRTGAKTVSRTPGQNPDETLQGFSISEDTTQPGGRMPLPAVELMEQLTSQFRMFEGCEKVTVLKVSRLDTPDRDGCNWSSSLVLDTGGAPPEVYAMPYADIITSARSTWNLK